MYNGQSLLQFLSLCDEVVFMNDGRILDQGKHTTLMSRNEYYASLIHTFLQEKENKEGNEEIQTAKLIDDE